MCLSLLNDLIFFYKSFKIKYDYLDKDIKVINHLEISQLKRLLIIIISLQIFTTKNF